MQYEVQQLASASPGHHAGCHNSRPAFGTGERRQFATVDAVRVAHDPFCAAWRKISVGRTTVPGRCDQIGQHLTGPNRRQLVDIAHQQQCRRMGARRADRPGAGVDHRGPSTITRSASADGRHGVGSRVRDRPRASGAACAPAPRAFPGRRLPDRSGGERAQIAGGRGGEDARTSVVLPVPGPPVTSTLLRMAARSPRAGWCEGYAEGLLAACSGRMRPGARRSAAPSSARCVTSTARRHRAGRIR
jgi:hypothetical protein